MNILNCKIGRRVKIIDAGDGLYLDYVGQFGVIRQIQKNNYSNDRLTIVTLENGGAVTCHPKRLELADYPDRLELIITSEPLLNWLKA
jgi:hypothetical protein